MRLVRFRDGHDRFPVVVDRFPLTAERFPLVANRFPVFAVRFRASDERLPDGAGVFGILPLDLRHLISDFGCPLADFGGLAWSEPPYVVFYRIYVVCSSGFGGWYFDFGVRPAKSAVFRALSFVEVAKCGALSKRGCACAESLFKKFHFTRLRFSCYHATHLIITNR